MAEQPDYPNLSRRAREFQTVVGRIEFDSYKRFESGNHETSSVFIASGEFAQETREKIAVTKITCTPIRRKWLIIDRPPQEYYSITSRVWR